MPDKHMRIIRRILTLDRINESPVIDIADKDEKFKEVFEWYENHYGLKIHNEIEEVHIIIEYTNIIWNYQIYWGSYKKRFKPLSVDDERWEVIENIIGQDLKTMGVEDMINVVLNKLMNKEHYEYHEKRELQFKKYYIKEEESTN